MSPSDEARTRPSPRPSLGGPLRKLALLCACLPAVALAGDLSEQEQRGKRIYFTGESPSQADLVALVGPARTETPAAIVPCVNCHGVDGRGESEADLPEGVALVGAERTEVPASVLPCNNCHGPDGRGLVEDAPTEGVAAADLRWATLAEPTGDDPPNGRKRPAYDEPLLRRAITRGVDPAGNPMHTAMPRYRLTMRDSEDLIAYIRRLGSDPEPPPAPLR